MLMVMIFSNNPLFLKLSATFCNAISPTAVVVTVRRGAVQRNLNVRHPGS